MSEVEIQLKSIFEYPFIVLNQYEWDVLIVTKKIDIPQRHKIHFFKTLRKSKKFISIVGNGNGNIVQVIIDEKELQVLSNVEKIEISNKMHLIQVPIKKKNLNLLVQKATEIGYKTIIFIDSKYNQNKILNIEKLLIVAENACMQSRNPYIPQIIYLKNKKIYNFNFDKNKTYIWGDWKNDSLSKKINYEKELVFINGPEGGWSKDEERFLKSNFLSVKLSNNVLRAETAAVCAGVYIQNASKW